MSPEVRMKLGAPLPVAAVLASLRESLDANAVSSDLLERAELAWPGSLETARDRAAMALGEPREGDEGGLVLAGRGR